MEEQNSGGIRERINLMNINTIKDTEMKRNCFITALCLLITVIVVGCSSWTEADPVSLPQTQFHSLTPQQEADLIKYKNSGDSRYLVWISI